LDSLVIAALGDSITAGTPLWDPDPAVRAAVAVPDETHAWPYWVEQSDPGVTVRNLGVDLERTDQIRERLRTALEGADVLIVQGGINDVVQGRDPSLIVADLQRMVQEGKSSGVAVAVTEVLPWNNGYPAHETRILDLNRCIAEMASREKVELVLFYEAIEDAGAPGRMRADWTTDGNHPSVEGHRRLAAAVVDALSRLRQAPLGCTD
jgi:lysophospholipase L1-like esterase